MKNASKTILVCPDGKVWKGETERISHGAYVWVEFLFSDKRQVLLVWNEHWQKWNIIGGHWEKDRDGLSPDGRPNYEETIRRELKEEFRDFLHFELNIESLSLEPLGIAEYISFSERHSKWTKYYHAVFKAHFSEPTVEREVAKKINDSSRAILMPFSEVMEKIGKKEPSIGNNIPLFLELFPSLKENI